MNGSWFVALTRLCSARTFIVDKRRGGATGCAMTGDSHERPIKPGGRHSVVPVRCAGDRLPGCTGVGTTDINSTGPGIPGGRCSRNSAVPHLRSVDATTTRCWMLNGGSCLDDSPQRALTWRSLTGGRLVDPTYLLQAWAHLFTGGAGRRRTAPG